MRNNLNNKTVNDIIKSIEDNEHDIKPSLREIVYDPIYEINLEGAATQDYYNEQQTQHEKFLKQAKYVNNFFSEIWYDKNLPDDQIRIQIFGRIKSVSEEIIPQIKDIVSYYDYCKDKKHYFSTTEDGYLALKDMLNAVKDGPTLCERLSVLYNEVIDSEPYENFNNKNLQKYYLLDLLQEAFDKIRAEIFYLNECEIASYQIAIDKEKFMNHILENIVTNIQNHAFNTPGFISKPLWDKKIQIVIEEVDDNYCITVRNNGEKFKGEVSKVFNRGYCYGKRRNTGIGMHSAKRHIMELGGSIDFILTPNEEYHVCYLLTIPKNGK